MTAADLIAVLFLSRDYAHKEHLRTTSYAAHMALGSFYVDIIEVADKFAEAYQGRKGEVIGEIPQLSYNKDGKPQEALKAFLKKVESMRDEVAEDDRPLQNLIDGICEVYLSTIYKLTILT